MRRDSFHEDLSRDESVERSSDRSFGFVFAGFFTLVAFFPLVRGAALRAWALEVAIAFLLVTLLVPMVLRPLNRVWSAFGLLLHRIVNPLVMGAMFFVVITPVAAFMKLIRRDVMKRRFDASAKSYWIERTSDGTDSAALHHQY